MHRKSSGYIKWVGCEDVVQTRTIHAIITDDGEIQPKFRLLLRVEDNLQTTEESGLGHKP